MVRNWTFSGTVINTIHLYELVLGHSTVKPVLSGHSKNAKDKDLKDRW